MTSPRGKTVKELKQSIVAAKALIKQYKEFIERSKQAISVYEQWITEDLIALNELLEVEKIESYH